MESPPPTLTDAERGFLAHLKQAGKGPHALRSYQVIVHHFLKHIGNERLDRVPEAVVNAYFAGITNANTKKKYASVVSQFIEFACAKLPVVVGRGSEMAPARAPTKKELALRQQWSLDKLIEQKEKTDDLIAQLARKLIDHYLYFQGRIKSEPENLDDVVRFADECRDLIERNLPLFMGLSAGGRNVHSKIDERVQK